jgi:NitT/TauT family transport system ATP-binding protein
MGGNQMIARYTGSDRTAGTALELRQVDLAFGCDGNRLPVLNQITLQIQPGELVAVLGPRGCGKSTLLRLAAGLEQSSSGTILLNGEATEAAPHLVLSRDPRLSASKTVQAQVAAALDPRRGPGDPTPHVDQALRLLGLNRFAGAYARELTAGTAQRVSLATALVNDPRLLLLDDPFVRLDPITRAAIESDLVSLWQRSGFTTLFATSDIDEALSVASRVIVLSAQPAHIALDLPIDCEFPRRPAAPGLAGARRALLQSLDGAGTSPNTGSLVLRDGGPSTRAGHRALMVWPGDEPAARHARALV